METRSKISDALSTLALKGNDAAVSFQAPGRICLFGEHQDYLGLPVIAAAIDRTIRLEATPSTKSTLRIELPDQDQVRIIDLKQSYEQPKAHDYFTMALRVMQRQGYELHNGWNIQIKGNIPINAGASSSTALVTVWVQFLLHATKQTIKIQPSELANLAHRVEVAEFGEPGGIMDHYSIAHGGIIMLNPGKGNHVIPIDCGLPGIILANSNESKQTLKGLSSAKSKVESAIAILTTEFESFDLPSVGTNELEEYLPLLPIEVRGTFEAAVYNHAITQAALQLFLSDKCDQDSLGKLMTEHHGYLRDGLGISTERVEAIIDIAKDHGAFGAKLNGSGGGGTVVILGGERRQKILRALAEKKFQAWPVEISDGAKQL